MNLPGPCSECGSPLDGDQRYCIDCGTRVGPPLALPYAGATPTAAAATPASRMSWLPMPLQAMTMFAALALGFGVVVGTALSPSLNDLLAAPTQVVEAPPEPTPEPAPSTGGGGGAAPAPVQTTGTDVFGSTGQTTDTGGGGGGGGGGKKPKPKPKPSDYLSGTVVHVNPVARSYTVASGGGLTSIHTVSPPAVGARIKVPVVQLENRTYNEDGKRELKGTATQATFAGVVTDARDSVDPVVPDTYTVTALGSSILVHSPVDATGALTPPPIGKSVTTTVDIRNAGPTPLPTGPPPTTTCAPPPVPLPDPPLTFPKELHQVTPASLVQGTDITATVIATVVQSLCPAPPAPAPGQFLLSSDDVREGKTDVELLNSTINMVTLSLGIPILASVSIVDDAGTKKLGTVTGVTSDQGEGAANSPGQGDLARSARRMNRGIAKVLLRAEKVREKRRQARRD